MRPETVLKNSRLAGQVERYHTWPTHRTQSVGEHTWQILRLYFLLFGPPAPHVTVYIVWHDAGELLTGDVGHVAKRENPELKTQLDELEKRSLVEQNYPSDAQRIFSSHADVSPADATRVKVCDLLDMGEFAVSEVTMGNMYAREIIDNVDSALRSLLGKMEAGDRARVQHHWARARNAIDV